MNKYNLLIEYFIKANLCIELCKNFDSTFIKIILV